MEILILINKNMPTVNLILKTYIQLQFLPSHQQQRRILHNNSQYLTSLSFNLQQFLQKLKMKAEKKIKYIQKTYQIFIRTIFLKDQVEMKFYSNNSAKQERVEGQITMNINKFFKTTTIDILSENQQKIDKDITFNIYHQEVYFAGLVFDINIQKLIKQSKTIFRKELKNKKGFIDYKFISCKTKIVDFSIFSDQNQKRQKIYLQHLNNTYQNIKQQNEKMKEVIRQKDANISHLTLKLAESNQQINNLSVRLEQELLQIKQGMNIKIKVGSNNQAHSKERQAKDLQKMLKDKDQYVKSLQHELKRLQLQIALMRDLNGYAGKEEQLLNEGQFKQCHLTKKLKKSDFFQSLDSDDSQVSLQQYGHNLPQVKPNTKLSSDLSIIKFPSSPNLLKKPSHSNNKQSKLIEQTKLSIIKVNKQSTIGKFNLLQTQNPISSQKLQYAQHQILLNKTSSFSRVEANSINNDVLRQKIESLKADFQIQRQQKLFLKQQNNKKSKQIQKLVRKTAQGEKQKLQFQQQKGRLLQMFANKLSLGDKDQNVKIIIKEMTNFNKTNQRQNANLIKENAKLNKKLNNQLKKNENLQLGYSQCVLKITQLNKEIAYYQYKCNKKMIDAQVQADFLSIKQQQECQMMKSKIIENQRDIILLKESEMLLKEQNKALKQQINALQQQKIRNQVFIDQNQILKLQLNRMAIKSLRGQKIEQNYTILIQNYQSLLASHDQLKIKLVKLQGNYNKNIKHDDLTAYQQQMDKVLFVMFREVNKFQKQFYGVLLLTNKASLQSQIKYYENFVRNQELYTRQWTESQKLALSLEKQKNLKKIKAKSAQLQQKINMKMLSFEQQIVNFEQGVTAVEQKLLSLQKFRDQMYSLLKSLNVQTSMILSIKQSTFLKSSASKTKLSIENIQILQQEENQEQQNDKDQNIVTSSTLKVQTRQQIKKSGLMQTSGKFQLTKLKHSIAVKKSLLNEGANIVTSKVFSMLKQDADMNASSHQIIAAKKQMSLQRMKIRDRQLKNFQQSSQMIKRIDNSLFDQKMQKDRIILQYQKRQKALQLSFQMTSDTYERKIGQLQTKVNQSESVYLKHQQQKAKMVDQINDFRNKITELKRLLQQATQNILSLQDQRDNLKQKAEKLQKEIGILETVERQLLKQIQRMKDFGKLNHQTIKQLIQQRSHKYEEDQTKYKKKISRMERQIKQLQARLIEESQQYFLNRSTLQSQIDRKSEQIISLTNKIHELEVTIENLSNQNQQLSAQNSQIQLYNKEYQRNLYQITSQFQNKEKQIMKMDIVIKTLQRERMINLGLSNQMKEKEAFYKQFYQSLNKSKQQVKNWQEKFAKLQFIQQKLLKQSQQRQFENSSLQNDKKALNQLIKKRQQQILKLERQISEKQLYCQNIELQIANIQYSFNQLSQQKQQIEKLLSIQKQEIQQAKDNKYSRRKKQKSIIASQISKSASRINSEQKTPIRQYGNLLEQQNKKYMTPDAQQFSYSEEQSYDSIEIRVEELIKENQQLKNAKLKIEMKLDEKSQIQLLLKNQLTKREEQVKSLKALTAKFEQKLKEKQSNIQKLIKQLKAYQKQTHNLQRQVSKLTRSLQIKTLCNLNNEIIHKQLIEVKGENNHLKSIINSRQTAVTQKQNKRKDNAKYLDMFTKDKANKIGQRKEIEQFA